MDEEEEEDEEEADPDAAAAGCPVVKGPLDCRTAGSILGAGSGALTVRPLYLAFSSSESAFHIRPK